MGHAREYEAATAGHSLVLSLSSPHPAPPRVRDRVYIARVSSQALLGIITRRIDVHSHRGSYAVFFHGERTPPGKSFGSQLWARYSLMSGSSGLLWSTTGCRHADTRQIRAHSRCPGGRSLHFLAGLPYLQFSRTSLLPGYKASSSFEKSPNSSGLEMASSKQQALQVY